MQIHELNTFSGILNNGVYLAVDNGADTTKIPATELAREVNSAKVNTPTDIYDQPTYGTAGQVLRTKGDGETEWATVGQPTDAQTAQAVNNWLDDHPEATTTVQDNSLTEAKFSDMLRLKTLKDYVTPEMFGAVGDGIADDTASFQEAIDISALNKVPLILLHDYYLTATITVPSKTTVISLTAHEEHPKIIIADNIGTVFNCTGDRNYFERLLIRPRTTAYVNYIGFRFTGNVNGDIDSVLNEVVVAYAEKGVYCTGRNLDILGGFFTHCRYGVHVYIPTELSAVRGININGVRFHGTGEEIEPLSSPPIEMLDSGDSASILLDADNGRESTQLSDVSIKNCIHDQGGTFVRGNAQNCLIASNFIVHWVQPAIIISGPTASSTKPGGSGSWNIVGNFIYGLNGKSANWETTGKEYDWADYAVTIENYGRINIVGNNFGRQKSVFNITKGVMISIIANCFEAIIGSDGNRYVMDSSNSEIYFCANVSQLETNLSDDAYAGSNICIAKSNMRIKANPYTLVSTFNSGDAVSAISHFNHFFVRKKDGKTMFEIYKNGNYFASTNYVNSDGTIDFIEVDSTNHVTAKRRATNGTVSTLSIELVMQFLND